MRRAAPWLVAAAVLALDRLTKLLVIRNIHPGDARIVWNGFSITHVHNRGIAFSFLADGGALTQYLLLVVISVTVAVVVWILLREPTAPLLARAALGAILGGALGNLADRLLYGWVVDFLHFWIWIGDRAYAWPDFNLADTAITVGAILLIAHEVVRVRRGGEGGGV